MKKPKVSVKNVIKPQALQKIKMVVLALLVSILLFLVFGKAILLPLFFPIGIVLGFYSTLASKFIPHITAETMTIMSIVVGLLFGMKVGFLYGLIVSMIVYVWLSMIKLTTIVNSLVIGIGGGFAGFFGAISPFDPFTTFSICLFVRAVIGIVIFWNITSDKLEAAAHAFIDPAFNIFIYMPFFYPIYTLLR